jgi:hypothetical protein
MVRPPSSSVCPGRCAKRSGPSGSMPPAGAVAVAVAGALGEPPGMAAAEVADAAEPADTRRR